MPAEEPSDAELILGSQGGGEMFALLYDRHVESMMAFFYRRTGCVETSADLTAETFAAAFASRRRFRDTGAPGRAWLMTIAARQLSHFIRREVVATKYRRRLGVRSIELTALDFERVEALAGLEALRPKLAEALAKLPVGQADAIRLRVVDEHSYGRVAELLGCTEGAARVRVSRGLSRLADELEM